MTFEKGVTANQSQSLDSLLILPINITYYDDLSTEKKIVSIMAELRKIANVVAAINMELSGEEINLKEQEKITPEHVNTYIVDCIEFYESTKKFDKSLLNQFKEDFNGCNVNVFKIANKNIRRELKEYLKNSGVNIGGQGQISDQLILLKYDECPNWPAEELEIYIEKKALILSHVVIIPILMANKNSYPEIVPRAR
ncbi:hypothetical protein HI914_04402 [Erysiphe necator]|nr:hypothetical protein HI914_04402 [Erysiphe necator]